MKRLNIVLGILAAIVVIVGAIVGLAAAIYRHPEPSRSTATATTNHTSTATQTEVISPTPWPPVTLTVSSNVQDGVRFTVSANAPASATYELTFVSGAYSPWASDNSSGFQGWETLIVIYKDGPVQFGPTKYGYFEPINAAANLGSGNFSSSETDASDSALGQTPVSITLEPGDYLTLAAFDQEGQYGDNRGSITVSITLEGS